MNRVLGVVVVVLSAALLQAGAVAAVPPSATFSLDPKRTYLRTSSDAPLDALKIDLGALGIASGMTIRLERLGGYDCGGPCIDDRVGMIGVFSAGTTLLASSQPHRVPGAIDAGVDIVSSPTFWGGIPTDIPQDFAISNTVVRVPAGATHLFVGAHDSLYHDNTDPNNDFGVRVSVEIPTAVDDAYAVDEDATLDVAAPGVLANDSGHQPSTAVLSSGPANGSLALNADGSFVYTPNANFNGTDGFTYKAHDGGSESAPATVTITVNAVNDAPTAAADAYAVDEDSTLSVPASGVLANDGDVEGDALSAVLVAGPANGVLDLHADGSFTYVPNANFNGADSFSYRADDGLAGSAPATVAITVNPVNDAPVASADGPYLGIIGSPVTFDASASSDVEGSALTYRWSFGDGSTAVTTSPNPTHAYAAAGIYTVTLVVNDGSLDSASTTTTATIGDPIGSNRGDVDAFLSYAAPTERTVQLPAGTTSFDVTILYGTTIDPATFSAELNGDPLAGFSPTPGTSQTVTIPLSRGRNVLAISVDGALADGKRASDRDRLTFVVGYRPGGGGGRYAPAPAVRTIHARRQRRHYAAPVNAGRTIYSLLSARVFLNPKLVDGRLYFLSDLSGRLSLYAMDADGSVPERLLPPDLALQNPELLPGEPYDVFPGLDRIVVMVDRDGDEMYQPLVVPLGGGFPEPVNADAFGGKRVHLLAADTEAEVAYFFAESTEEATNYGMRLNVATAEVDILGESTYGAFPVAWTRDHRRVILGDGYSPGDVVLYENDNGTRRMLWGVPLDEREEGAPHPLLGLRAAHVTDSQRGLLLGTGLFDDGYGPSYLALDGTGDVEPVTVEGVVHEGAGELERYDRLEDDRYLALYNIDGEAWAYEAVFDEPARKLTLERVLCGQEELSGGVVHGVFYDRASRRFALSFCTARMPTQLYVVDENPARPRALTRERPLGVDADLLAAGEDASFVSHDGTRISARLYVPDGPGRRPLVYYIHGGPQSQERPNFAWFSMPLIQTLVLQGFAVFVPNARGSTGYGLEYMKQVDRDWGGRDRLDHVHAMTEVLPRDERIDVSRAGVVGRSYGGYMTLTLAARHPELWSAAVDMFGPYDLRTFVERVPPTWKPYFELTLGHPERDRDFYVERSPKTHIGGITCPLLVIQGANDPRVIEQESRDVVEDLRAQGKDVEYLVFEDEGHDVLKLENRVRCYSTIVEFFARHLAR